MPIRTYTIKKIETKKGRKKSGVMIPLWKDYDLVQKMRVRFVYYSTCAPKTEKGPYLHKKRRGLLTLLEGKAIFVYKVGKKFKETKLDASKKITMLDIPKGIGYLIKNPYSAEAKFINICDYPWKPNENETVVPQHFLA